MNISPRTKTLLDRLPKDHPLTPSMRDAMIAALAAAEQLADRKSTLARDGRHTELGRQQTIREELTTTYGKRWARAKASVTKARKEIEAERSALVIKPVDPANVAAALERQEIRAWVRQLDLGVRQSIILGTNDRRLVEAVVSAPPELSGFAGDAAFASKVEAHYFELVYPDKLASIEAKNDVVAEAEASMHISRNEMRSTVDMHQHDFDELMRPVETVRVWLLDNDRQVCEIGSDGRPTYRAATETDVAFGVRYENFDAYKRAQGLADAA